MAFSGCSSLDDITVNSEKFKYEKGILYTTNTITFISSKYYQNETEFTIPAGITTFNTTINNLKITTLNIPSTVTTLSGGNNLPSTITNVNFIGNNQKYYTKENCIYEKGVNEEIALVFCYSKEKEIKLTEKVTNLKYACFWGCPNVTTLNMPDTVTYIGNGIFYSPRNNIKNINIGKGVSEFGTWAFDTGGLKITVDDENPYFTMDKDILYSKDKKIIYKVAYDVNGKFELNSNVQTIAAYAFSKQYNMTELILNEGLTKIENNILSFDKISKIEIPSTVKSIDSGALAQCNNLKQVIIKNKKGSISGSPWSLPIGERGIYWNS